VNESFAICHSSANAVTVEHSLMFDHLWVGWYISSQSARLWAEPGLRKHAKREASLNAVPISPDPQKSNLNPLDHPGGAGWSSRGATESTPYGKRATGQLLILQAWRQVFSDSSILEKSLCIFLLPKRGGGNRDFILRFVIYSHFWHLYLITKKQFIVCF